MRLLGAAAATLFLFDTGDGWGRLLELRDGGAPLFDEHRLDPDLVATVQPVDARAQALEVLATLIARHGEPDPECPRTRTFGPEQLAALACSRAAGALAA